LFGEHLCGGTDEGGTILGGSGGAAVEALAHGATGVAARRLLRLKNLTPHSCTPDYSWRMSMPRTLLVLNAIAAAATVAGAAWVLVQSFGFAAPSDTWSRYYAVRGILISGGLLLTLFRGPRSVAIALMIIAGLVQLADIPVAAVQPNLIVVVGATLIAATHLISAWWLMKSGWPSGA